MKLKINEAKFNNSYFKVNYGGTWNHGTEICYTESELETFLTTHIFDRTPEVLSVVNETDKWKSIVNTENSTKLNKTGKKELFDYGITSINNKE